MENELKEEVLSRIDAVAAKLGVASERLWEVFVTQSYLNGMTGAIWITLIMIISLTCMINIVSGAVKHAKAQEHLSIHDRTSYYFCGYNNDTPTVRLFILSAVALFFIISLIGVVVEMPQDIRQILNPEYYAWLEIRSILE